jgi:CRISPR-associated endoribonuclease Cas6
MKETLQTKLEKAGIESEDFEIKFNPLIGKATTKLVRYKSIENRASWCPITINGSNKLKQFAWNVGIGNSTGIGFGAIK